MRPSSGQAIYVRLPNWVGDVCMSLPGLEALLATGLPVVVCARPWAEGFLATYPLSGFIPMGPNWHGNRHAVRRWRRQAAHLQARGLLFPDSLSSALSFRLAGIPSAGYRDDGRSFLLRWPVNKPPASLHVVQSGYHLVRTALARWHLRLPADTPPPRLHWRASPAHQAEAEQALVHAALEPARFVLIAPTATGRHHGQNKVWNHFDALTRELQARGHPVVMVPPATEQADARAAAPTARLLPPMTLGGFAALTARAALVVCNDSGVSHLSAAARARQITLFGVTDPQRTGPWSDRADRLGTSGQWPAVQTVQAHCLSVLEGSADT